jgi:voltage-gated potassium channel
MVESAAASRRVTTRHCPECMSEGHEPTSRFCRDCGTALPPPQFDSPS